MSGDQFVVELTPLPTAARVAKHRRALRWRVLSALISAVIFVVLWFVARDLVPTSWLVTIVALWAVTTVIWLVVTFLALSRAKRDLAAIPQGAALVIDREGMRYVFPTDKFITWAELSAVKIAGPSWGAGPQLRAFVGDATVASIPMSFIDVMPSAIDSAVSAYSLGRARLDVSELDRLL